MVARFGASCSGCAYAVTMLRILYHLRVQQPRISGAVRVNGGIPPRGKLAAYLPGDSRVQQEVVPSPTPRRFAPSKGVLK